MSDDEYLKSIREDLKQSVDFFSSRDKFILEKWVVNNFLTNLSIDYGESELLRGGDPPDVIFRDAQFEVKEIMDKGRKRHAEFKQALARANVATDPAELLEEYSPKDLTISEVYDLVYTRATDLAERKYPPQVRKQMDLLCYVNLDDVMGLIETPYPDVSFLAALGYRSVSFLDGHRSCVFCAKASAPSFLNLHHGIAHRVIR